MSTWIILGFAGLGIISAIIAFLKTPPNRRYRFSTPQIPIEERLAACPKKAEAVIIKANKKRFLVNLIPVLCFCVVLYVFLFFTKAIPDKQCEKIFGINLAYLYMVILAYVLPMSVFIISLFVFKRGLKTIMTGYFLPLDSIVFKDTIARKGFLSMFLGVIALISPVLGGYTIYLGHNLHQAFTKGDKSAFLIQLEAKCQKK